ncbi:ABC transporter ATP-binding protein [Brachybacterium sp. DNPG3]
MTDRPPGAGATGLAVAVRGLTVRRGRRDVLHDVDLEVACGTICGLLGPSGSGKTTLIRAIVGSQRITGGTIEVLGERAGSAGLRSHVGYVTQAASVYDDLTVGENLTYFARLLRRPDRVAPTLAATELAPYAGRRVDALSGGQRSRVSLAVALLGEPELLVLDEPTVGLDPLLRASLWAMFARLAADGTTLLVSSHVMDEAAHCTDLVLLREGRTIAQGAPSALVTRTGAADIEGAFIALATSGAASAASAAGADGSAQSADGPGARP